MDVGEEVHARAQNRFGGLYIVRVATWSTPFMRGNEKVRAAERQR